MTTINVVTEGEYSDRRILAVFDAAAALQAFIGPHAEHYDVHQIPLNPAGPVRPAGLTSFRVYLNEDGSHHGIYSGQSNEVDEEASRGYTTRSLTSERTWRFMTTVWAEDAHHALKIASERLFKLQGEGWWSEGKGFKSIDLTPTEDGYDH